MPGRTARLLACMLLARTAPALALDPALDISQYAHTAWKIREGFTESPINSIAQTPDGYLWLGTLNGLFRFDGVRKVQWVAPRDQHLPSDRVVRLLVGRDGTLWIGTDRGLASWKGLELRTYPELAESYVSGLVEDRDGSLWAGSQRAGALVGRLCEIKNGNALCSTSDGRLVVSSLLEDSHGVLWVGTIGGLWRWKPGAPQFYPVADAIRDGVKSPTQYSNELLFGSNAGLKRLVSGKAEAFRLPNAMVMSATRTLLVDRDGSLWIGSIAGGLVHLHQGRVDRFGQADGLSGDFAYALFEDREGNIWYSSNNGLDRFRNVIAATFTAAQGVTNTAVLSVLADRNGTVWLGTFGGLKRWDRGEPIGRDVAGKELSNVGITSLLQDDAGRIWIGTINGGVGYLENDRFSYVPGVPGGVVHSIVQDAAGSIWIANQHMGLFHVSDRRLVERIPWASLGSQAYPASMAADRRGGVWFGFPQGGVAYFVDGQLRVSYTAGSGLGSGRVSDLRLDQDDTLWAATDGGLSRLTNGHIATLTKQNGLPCDAVWWVVEDDARSLWMEMPCGLVRVARAELDAWASAVDTGADRTRTIQTTVFDNSDGVRASGISGYSPRAAKASDGRIWYHGPDGVHVVDPRHIAVNTLQPPVSIEQIVADRHTYDTLLGGGANLDLPALTRDLEIDYTALSLVAPEKNQFRYQLEGFDRDWQSAGNRRQAFYTHLPPRRYRFRVIASNNSGVWNESGAAFDFTIPPAYYQAAWFRALTAGMLLAFVWTAHRVRLRIVERHQSEISALNERLMKAQEQERIRIAGELHDGVMQQMLAVTMMLGTAKRKIAGNAADAEASIDRIQQKVIQAGTELRQLSHGLHPPQLQAAGLPSALRSYCEQFSTASEPAKPTRTYRRYLRRIDPAAGTWCNRTCQDAPVARKEPHMSTIRFHQNTTSTPEQFIAGLTDFGPGRSQLFGNSADDYLKVHRRGPSDADVTEGSGGIWERLHYDWSNPNRVVMATTDSNVWGGRSGHTYTLTRRVDGTTDLDAVVIREGKNLKGWVLGLVLGTIGKGVLRKAFENSVKAIEARNAAGRIQTRSA